MSAEELGDGAVDSANAAAAESAMSQRGGKRAGFWRGLREFVLVIGMALLLSALIRTVFVQAFWVPSGSMEQTLVRNDRILAWKLATPGRGDVVVFRDPGGWLGEPVPDQGVGASMRRVGVFLGLMPSDSGDDLVKRVIGVGGDTIECCSPQGEILRNGQALDEPYIYPGEPTNQVRFKITVPAGRLFVMGDHRSDSADSRFHLESNYGTVPVSNVVGRAVLIMWPADRWATLPNYG